MNKYVELEEKRFNELKNKNFFFIYLKGIGIYISHILLIHSFFWIVFQIYSQTCVPSGFSGFFKSLIYHGSFFCKAIYSMIDFSSNGIYSMITHLISGLSTSQWLSYEAKKIN